MGDAWIGPRFFQPELAVRVARQQNDYLVALIGMLNRISARRLGCARFARRFTKPIASSAQSAQPSLYLEVPGQPRAVVQLTAMIDSPLLRRLLRSNSLSGIALR